MINKPRRWFLGLNNYPPESIKEQNFSSTESKGVIFSNSCVTALEAYFSEIDQKYYYGFSFKLLKVVTDSLGVFRLDAGGERGSEQWLTQMEGLKEQSEAEQIDDKKQREKLVQLLKDETKLMRKSGFVRQRNQMSSSITFPTLLTLLQEIYSLYAEKQGLNSVKNPYTFGSRISSRFQKLFGSSEVINSEDHSTRHNDDSNVLNPDKFILEVIEILEDYFKPLSEVSSFNKEEHNIPANITDVHGLWEFESNRKIKELMKINSFANENKHLRLFDLMSGATGPGQLGLESNSQSTYFAKFLNARNNKSSKKDENLTESEKFLLKYQEIVNDMDFNGMPLSLNERITVLNSKTAQLIGLYTTLKKKQQE